MTPTMIAAAIRKPLLSLCAPRELRVSSLQRQPRMRPPSIAEGRELRGERRDRTLGERFRRPAAVAVHHANRSHMTVERQFAGALMKYLAVDLAPLLGGEKDAERRA